MTSKGDNRYDSHLEIKGAKNDILNLLSCIVEKLIKAGMDPMYIFGAFITGMEEKENGKSNNWINPTGMYGRL